MFVVRRLVALILAVTVMAAGLAVAQDPPAQQQNQAKAKAAAKKKAARRKPKGDPLGVIVPYPFPPVLIIKHTPETHEEIQALLFMLRYY